MRVDLTGQHFELNIVLLLLQQAFLVVALLDLVHKLIQPFDHPIKLSGQLPDFILAVDRQECLPRPAPHFRHMLAKTQQTSGNKRGRAIH
ncbi:hypothetical protein D3C77_368140 [compost metagenome]